MSFFYLLSRQWIYTDRRNRYKIVLIYLSHFLSFMGVILFPYVFRRLLDSLGQLAPGGFSSLLFWLGMLFLCYCIFEVFHRIARFLEYNVAGGMRVNLVDHLFRHLYNIPLAWHQEHHSGDTINRVRLASESLFRFVEEQHVYMRCITFFWGPIVSLWFIKPDLAVLLGVLSIISLVVNYFFDRKLIPIIRRKNDTIHLFNGVLFDFLSNIETLITLGIGKRTERFLNAKSERVSQAFIKENNLNQMRCQAASFFGFLIEIGVLFYYIFTEYRNQAAIDIVLVVQIYQYLQITQTGVGELAGNYYDVVKWATDFSSIDAIMAQEQKRHDFSVHLPSRWEVTRIENLSFAYQQGEVILDDFDLTLRNGSTLAVTGRSGAGKSTLFKVLRGIYPSQSGSCTIDGTVYEDLSRIHGLITLIPQTCEIFENTLLYNITFGMDVEKEYLQSLLKIACLEDLISRLPHGLETKVYEKGVNLSGGEQQRITLARGLFAAKQSPIIILDEPTSSVDMNTEQIIFERLFDFFHGRCIIASVHRRYLLSRFDAVFDLTRPRSSAPAPG